MLSIFKSSFYLLWSTDEFFYDSAAILESDCSEEDFQSVLDGVDVFLSQGKIDHIARFVELPIVGSSSGELPSILVVNVQF
ncbi:hypothetical protein L6452_35878 [Arctium lappa]|uniref:Uncharacterized protein n=1 Tax=Arctium lappa TaxID=4217 RepID=A0ACB8Y8D9_ARCLA|nr:hypothetical protein L6452_35878 [Arctium lappa]